ncbi:hypothetical protein N9A28_07260 [Sulfurimonas sp.]|nr:hypothetical protein [Sulfurimonas sp.]
MSNIYSLLLLTIVYTFTGCTATVSPKVKTPEDLPSWVNTLDTAYAVGSSPVNFQGIYTQHISAVNQAKNDLAHNIKSYITSSFENNLKTSEKTLTKKQYSKITTLSDTLLSESYQLDAYFTKDRRLYVLIHSPQAQKVMKDALILPTFKTTAFDKSILMKSRCYSPTVLETINTKSDLYQNKPIWFFRPNQNQMYGSVGIAEKEEGMSFEEQKEIATFLAKSSLAKRKKVKLNSEYESLSILNNNTTGNLFERSSITKSESNVEDSDIKDIWLDPKSCELYIWNVLTLFNVNE